MLCLSLLFDEIDDAHRMRGRPVIGDKVRLPQSIPSLWVRLRSFSTVLRSDRRFAPVHSERKHDAVLVMHVDPAVMVSIVAMGNPEHSRVQAD